MTRAFACLLALTLTACATTGTPEPVTRVVEVKVPVPVPCPVTIPAEPDWPDTDAKLAAAPDLFSRVQMLLAGRVLRMAYEGEQRAALRACVG